MNRARVATGLFLISTLALLSLFLVLQVRRSGSVTLWLDETHSLLANSRGQSAAELLTSGARSQGSPAPLTYLLEKALDRMRVPAGYLGLSYAGYYRIVSIAATGLLGFGAALLVVRRRLRDPAGMPAIQLFTCACALAAFYFNLTVYEYASESRPYALWNSLWFLALAAALDRPVRPWLIGGVMTLVALTATASCFQILAMAVALGLASKAEGKTWKAAISEVALILALPAVVGIYYALRAGMHSWTGEEYGTWPRFLKFWLRTHGVTWLVTLAVAAAAWSRPTLRKHSTPLTAMLILLLLGPLIYGLTRAHGFFYHPRQYVYHALTVPVALLAVAAMWPTLIGERRRGLKTALLAVACLLAVGLNVSRVVRRAELPKGTLALELLQPGCSFAALLATERPRALWYEESMSHDLKDNLTLLAEWIDVRRARLPRGVRDARLYEREGRLVAEVDGSPPTATWSRIPLAP